MLSRVWPSKELYGRYAQWQAEGIRIHQIVALYSHFVCAIFRY